MKQLYIIFLLFFSICLFYGCLNDPELPNIINGKAPTIENFKTVSAKATSIEVTAEITKHNGSKATEYGYYFEKEDSGKKDSISVIGVTSEDGIIKFDTIIKGLLPETGYLIEAYAKNSIGISTTESIYQLTGNGYGTIETIKPGETDIKGISAEITGNIISAGEDKIIERGFYFSQNEEDLNENNWKTSSTIDSVYTKEEENPYTLTISSLTPETKYYVRAYAKNKFGTFVGEIQFFTTKDGKPNVIDPFDIKEGFTSVEISAEVTDEGDAEVTERGFCYSKSEASPPTIGNVDTDTAIVGKGSGKFTTTITDLDSETTYYVRSYAENKYGIRYSEKVISFSTISVKPSVETVAVTPDNGIVTVSGNVKNQGMTPIDSAGICWSTSPTPTLDMDSVLTCSNKVGSYSGIIRSLKGGTKYYIRAFASNKNETAYGEVIEYTPPAIFQLVDAFPGDSYTANTPAYFSIKDNNKNYIRTYMVGGDVGSKYTNKLWMYDPNSRNKWEEKKAFPGGERKWMTAVGVGDIGYVLGGSDQSGNISDDFYRYTPHDNTWEKLATGPAPLHSAAGVYIPDNFAFFIGGFRTNAIKEVWYFNTLAIPSWNQVTDFPIAQYGGTAVSIDKTIYAGLGIKEDGTFNNKFWSSSDNCNTWDSQTSFPLSTGSIKGGVVHKGLIYVININTGNIWCYNPIEKVWTKKSQVSVNRFFHCMFTLDEINNGITETNIYIGLGQYSNELIKYNPTWDN